MELPIIQRTPARLGLLALVAILVCAPAAAAQEALPYTVQFNGPENPELHEVLREMSESLTLRETRPVASVVHLERRANRDAEDFLAYLNSHGYYAATVDVRIDAEVQPVSLTFTVDAGPQYTLTQVEIVNVTPNVPGITEFPEPESLGLREGTPFEAQAVLDAEQRLVARLREQGHAFATAPDRDVIVDHADQSVSVTFKIEPGPKVAFGPLHIEGLDRVQASVVESYIAWKEGDLYDPRLVEKTQTALYRSGLFSTVRIGMAGGDEPTTVVPMTIDVAERKPRTIAAGIQFRTDEGASLRLHWEHRNIGGLGRTLSYDVHLGQIQTSIETKYILPRWRRNDQTLELSAHAGEWSPDAYTSRRVGLRAWAERQLSPKWRGGTGISLRWDDIEQDDASQQYHLISNPWRFSFDDVNDPLDPTMGRRLILRAEPFAGVGESALFFAKSQIEYSHYFPLDDNADWVLATRARVGFSLGAGLREMPPDERYYAGGAASIRGYAYQSVGPIDEDDDPIGGLSVFDGSIELRRKITESIGVVAFLDAGSAFEDAFPTSSSMRYGAGLGMRYYTPIGPIGADIAVPLNKRDFDDSFQIYITLGQSF